MAGWRRGRERGSVLLFAEDDDEPTSFINDDADDDVRCIYIGVLSWLNNLAFVRSLLMEGEENLSVETMDRPV